MARNNIFRQQQVGCVTRMAEETALRGVPLEPRPLTTGMRKINVRKERDSNQDYESSVQTRDTGRSAGSGGSTI